MATAEAVVDTNPFVDSLRFKRRVPDSTIVIFGANGDLTKRKLLPALYSLALDRRLSAGFAIIGNSRTEMSHQAYREKMKAAVREFSEHSDFDEEVWEAFAQGIYYLPGNVKDPACYEGLRALLDEIAESRHTADNVVFYLSTQPSLYGPIAEQLGASGLAKSKRAAVGGGSSSKSPSGIILRAPGN